MIMLNLWPTRYIADVSVTLSYWASSEHALIMTQDHQDRWFLLIAANKQVHVTLPHTCVYTNREVTSSSQISTFETPAVMLSFYKQLFSTTRCTLSTNPSELVTFPNSTWCWFWLVDNKILCIKYAFNSIPLKTHAMTAKLIHGRICLPN